MSSCKVYLENYNFAYFPGDEIRGRLECDLATSQTVRNIKVRLICREHTHWSKTQYYPASQNRRQSREVHYSGSNDCISIDYILFGSDSGSSRLGGGKHVYSFTITLPEDIPATFFESNGNITYRIRGIINRLMASNYKDDCIFKVHAPKDFNKMPRRLQEPATYFKETTVSAWCCSQGGTISMDLELPKRAFVPEEEVKFKVRVCNMSNLNVQSVNVLFTQTLTFRTESWLDGVKEKVYNLVKMQEHGVGAHGEHTFELKFTLSRYHIVPNFARCSLFRVDYLFKVFCQLPACSSNLEISTDDVMLGHVKWAEEGNSQMAVIRRLPPGGSVYSNPEALRLPPSAPPPEQIASAPSNEDFPPSYRDAVQMASSSIPYKLS